MSTSETSCKHVFWLMLVLFLSLSAAGFGQPAPSQPAGAKQAGAAAPMAGATTAGATTAGAATKATNVPAVSGTTPPANNGAAKPATGAGSQAISKGQAVYLVRSTLMMLNDANRSGNYTVLRDLAAPEFQSRNSAADLAQSFTDLRRRKFDLFAVSFAPPQFSSDPALDTSGRVRLTGFFATQPLQINFDLTFESVDGQWKLFAISVATPAAPKQQSSASQPAGKGFYKVRLFSGMMGWRW